MGLQSAEIRSRFIEFFKYRGHATIQSVSLVTSDEKGITNLTLFNTAGMQPLIPYLLGKPFFADGKETKRLVGVQKCLRTVDIDDVGDNTHATFFEMLGNWSLGDYFKKEAIEWSYEFLTSKSDISGDRGLGLDPNRLYITVFEGDANAPRDLEAAAIWKTVFKSDKMNQVRDADIDTESGAAGRIFFMPSSSNWWQAGENGPCGPDTEMYYDIGDPQTGEPYFGGRGITKEQFIEADRTRKVVEVWNDVFMQYEKKDGVIIGKLSKPSVDTGAGLERLAMTLQGVNNIFETDLLKSLMEKIAAMSKSFDLKSARIIADHIRAATFLIADGVAPSNTDRGYVLRKLIRRIVRHAHKLGITKNGYLVGLVDEVVKVYGSVYSGVREKQELIQSEILNEEKRFAITLKQGLKEFEKGTDAFTLFSSYGFPLELTLELAKENGRSIDVKDFEDRFKAHQELSRTGAEKKFKGGLADANDDMVVRYHTATHLLHQALSDVLGGGVMQKGSNITPDRLRFDFTHTAKMTDLEKKRVEEIVNEKINEALPVSKIILPRSEAEKTGAKHFFGDKYGDEISIYFIGRASTVPDIADLKTAYSKEFCGGPHVANTNELSGPQNKWKFKIQKEEAVAQGVRRIKAVLGE